MEHIEKLLSPKFHELTCELIVRGYSQYFLNFNVLYQCDVDWFEAGLEKDEFLHIALNESWENIQYNLKCEKCCKIAQAALPASKNGDVL